MRCMEGISKNSLSGEKTRLSPPYRALLSQFPELIDELCPCAKVCVLRGGGILVSYLGVVTY